MNISAWNGLGMRGNASCPMILENVKIDERFRIGAAGSGLDQIFNTVGPFFYNGISSCLWWSWVLNPSDSIIDYQ